MLRGAFRCSCILRNRNLDEFEVPAAQESLFNFDRPVRSPRGTGISQVLHERADGLDLCSLTIRNQHAEQCCRFKNPIDVIERVNVELIKGCFRSDHRRLLGHVGEITAKPPQKAIALLAVPRLNNGLRGFADAAFHVHILTAATSSFTCCTLVLNILRSASSNSISMTFSTPAEPSTHGTPTK